MLGTLKKKKDGFTEKQHTDRWFRDVKTNLSSLQSILILVFYEQASMFELSLKVLRAVTLAILIWQRSREAYKVTLCIQQMRNFAFKLDAELQELNNTPTTAEVNHIVASAEYNSNLSNLIDLSVELVCIWFCNSIRRINEIKKSLNRTLRHLRLIKKDQIDFENTWN